ncbi:MAG: DNA-directed RNA polymerase subunit beta', partial [Thermodesulfobacteriota bacterium]
RAEQTTIEVRHGGIVSFRNLRVAVNSQGDTISMNRSGDIAIKDEEGRERETLPIIYGARLKVKDGQKVNSGAILAEWDPYTIPILTEASGTVKFGDVKEGKTMTEKVDRVTGISSKVIVNYREGDMRPRVSVKDDSGRTHKIEGVTAVARYLLPVGAIITVNEKSAVKAGDIIAKIPRETTKTKDITGGLPRVAELFEARKPKECSVITEIDGVVSFGKDTKGKRKVVVTPDVGDHKEYLIPKGKHISVREGDMMVAGEQLMDGSINPHDILSVLGLKELAKYLVDEVQEVYRLQGVKVNDKHIETVVRQMLRKVLVKEAGDTELLPGEQAQRHVFEDANEKVLEEGGRPAVAEPLLQGITKASLSTESFISAASFQETTKVLTEAALCGKRDYLKGLKENVIMGRLIPAGTGYSNYKSVVAAANKPPELEVPEPSTGDIDISAESLAAEQQ